MPKGFRKAKKPGGTGTHGLIKVRGAGRGSTVGKFVVKYKTKRGQR